MPTGPRRAPAKVSGFSRSLGVVSESVSRWTGSSVGFGTALAAILAWGAVGPMVKFSETWQLVINTGTTVVTFLMVFLLQRQQNKDALAIQLKLDELVAAIAGASNRLIDVESMTEEDLETLRKSYSELAVRAKAEPPASGSHSIEEARASRRRRHRSR